MFRFTIRELLLVTVIVALVASWWLDRAILVSRAELSSERAAVLESVIRSAGWDLTYDGHGIHISR